MSKNSILRKQKQKQEIKAENKKRKKQKVTDFEFSQFVLNMNHVNMAMVHALLNTIFDRPFTNERLNHKALRGAKQGEHEIEPGVYLSGKGTE